uniref:Polycystin cation channel PKD1/PKD2 domain-containing protein n=1 Tax=Haptolina brevifila TaxID=156173 RepID=A0A7S2BTN0_9EUKA
MPGAAIAMTVNMRNREAENDRHSGQPEVEAEPKEAPSCCGKTSANSPVFKCVNKVMDILNHMAFQTILYMAFVGVFQLLTSTMRIREEFYLDKHVMDRIIENHFDSSHNTFESIRRTADVYEWGNNVLWPGLLGDMGPCNSFVGSINVPKECVDEVWPDGDASFHLVDATPYDVSELVERMDLMDWTEGIIIRQSRAAPTKCDNTPTLGVCYPELLQGEGNQAAYGHNWTNPTQPPLHPYTFLTTDDLGSNPDGQISASIPSMRPYDTSGYVAVVIPFFSDTYLEPEEGPAANVTDYRLTYVNTTNGKQAKYYCVRLSPNGLHVKQLCDAGTGGNGTGRLLGTVRSAIEEMWNDLKRGHYIDAKTRVMTITLQLRANHVGVRYRMTMMLEFTALGAILPSYDVETRIIERSLERNMAIYADVALGMVIFFCFIELVELLKTAFDNKPTYMPWSYLSDMWNLMDWANFVLFYLVWWRVQTVYQAIDESPEFVPCSSYLCSAVGYFDDWKVMTRFRSCKVYLSLCVCIQLFKVLKFLSQLVPKTGLATNVLRKSALDLLFFGVTFIVSMLAFSMMLFVQLGPIMEDYIDQGPALISLFRALFGDFDIDEIMDNSSGYLNALLFLGYLFVAVFIMLSLFLAILAEGQIAVRDDDMVRFPADGPPKPSELQEKGLETPFWKNEYGVVSYFGNGMKSAISKSVGHFSASKTGDEAESSTEEALPSASSKPNVETANVDLASLMNEVRALREEMAASRGLGAAAGKGVTAAADAKPIGGGLGLVSPEPLPPPAVDKGSGTTPAAGSEVQRTSTSYLV